MNTNVKINTFVITVLALTLFSFGCSAPEQETAAKVKTEKVTFKTQVQTVKQAPTEEDWQASYKKLALNEALSFIEMYNNGTLSADRHESMIKVTLRQSEKISGEDKPKFIELADAIKDQNFNTVSSLYDQLEGE